jgi:predicted short-subunit dehydrogenase-like oxidoreductase (DUF2520 family)
MTSVCLIGAGNVGQQFYQAFKKSQVAKVTQWYNRTKSSISSFQNEVTITDDISRLTNADLYILAVSDDQISEISKTLPFSDRLVVHTCGAVNIHDLDKKNRRGVFYPLQTFSKSKIMNFENVPLCIEALDKNDYILLKSVATSFHSPVYKISSEQRLTLHLSAVFINNFSNHLYRISHEISDAKQINFDLLKPLIQETANKIQHMSPYLAQTGPGIRNDKKTIKKHLKLIEKPLHKDLYELLTKSIKNTHGTKKL